VRFQKLMWRNIMRSTKSQKVSVLYYSIDYLLIKIRQKTHKNKQAKDDS
jgi:hypothetical protein